MKELRNEYMDFKYIRNVFSLNVSENINEPFEMLVRWADPQKIDLRDKKKVVLPNEETGAFSHFNEPLN